MKGAYVSVSIFAIVLVLMSGVPFMSGGVANSAYARYVRNTQTQANTNNCSNGSNCAITSPQTQGDGSASSPTNVQISRFNVGQGEESTPPRGAINFNVTGADCTSVIDILRSCLIISFSPAEYYHHLLECYGPPIDVCRFIQFVAPQPAPEGTYRCDFSTMTPGLEARVIPCIKILEVIDAANFISQWDKFQRKCLIKLRPE